MSKYNVLTRDAAIELGVIDASGNELEHSATAAQVSAAAESSHDFYAAALAAAKDAGADRWVLDESGDSEFVGDAS